MLTDTVEVRLSVAVARVLLRWLIGIIVLPLVIRLTHRYLNCKISNKQPAIYNSSSIDAYD